jgi:N-acetylneuraminate synthase/N,N'-diacetyllegionaminate synthase
MATLDEISEAVKTFRDAGGRDLILLHCTSAYPTPPEDVNLRRIPALAAAFQCPVGFSDHTEGAMAALGALALGACFIEKHFTLDQNLPGPDHRFSSDPAEFRALSEAVRTLERTLGAAEIRPAPSEETGRREFRLSCVAARDLPAGHCMSEADIAYRRPGTGLPPRDAHLIAGKRLRHDVKAGKLLELCDVN